MFGDLCFLLVTLNMPTSSLGSQKVGAFTSERPWHVQRPLSVMHDTGYAQQVLGWFVDTGVCGNVELRAAEGICSLATRSLSPDSVEKVQIYLETMTSEDIAPSLVAVRNWKMGGPHLLESLKTEDGSFEHVHHLHASVSWPMK